MNKTVIHFLNVGHGDCTIIEHPSGRLTMIDINNSKSLSDKDVAGLAAALGVSEWEFRRAGSILEGSTMSWEDYYKSKLVDPHDYYKTNFDGRSIFRYVQTHPDMDHMSGLDRFFWQEQVPLWNFWDVAHAKTMTDIDFTKARYDYRDWEAYQNLRAGNGPISTHTVKNNLRFAKASYWVEDGLSVLSPSQSLIDLSDEKEEWNNVSYVLRLEFGGRSVLLPGDAVQEAWAEAVEQVHPNLLSADILKAAHHGRKSGYHKEAVDLINPHAVICSVGKKPETDAHQDYKAHGAEVYSTRNHGTIVVTMWEDGEVWVKDSAGKTLTSLAPLSESAKMARALFGGYHV